MQKLTLALTIIALTSLSPISALHAEPIAMVNGKPITQAQYQALSAQHQAQGNDSIDSRVILEELINREVLFQESLRVNLDKDPEIAQQLETLKKNFLIQALIAQWAASQPITEEDLKEAYDQHIAGRPDLQGGEVANFEDVKEMIRPVIQNKRLQTKVVQLRSKAKIER